ncbi:ATP-binding cassette domain-containing protein [Micromonospora sp. CPCC 206061]|uniref:ATP-binding cassette domain-containing protein n=1 Tax=Micromonospora sp. CPCC 206061 TaxID=3122410 RepID=UPI002FEE8EC2
MPILVATVRTGICDGFVVEVGDVVKTYRLTAGEFVALAHLGLGVANGEFVAVVGHAGSGKTTLPNLLTGIDRTSGRANAPPGVDVQPARLRRRTL